MSPLSPLVLALLCLPARALTPGSVVLASKGRAQLEIIVSTSATPRVESAARTLAQHLERITGAPFKLSTGDGASGVAIGVVGDFPRLGLDGNLDESGLARREQYLLRSHAHGLVLLGATELAIEEAVWDLLYRIGHRQFFPGPTWESVPRRPDLSITLDALESPSYFTRSIWYGFGTSDINIAPFAQWQARNRAPGGFLLKTGHAYQAIIKRHENEFGAHPEYLGLLNGRRASTKFCVSNPGLRDLVVRDALAYFQEKPDADSYSIEPSDGGDWCECASCSVLGAPSDRALLLANAVAAAVAMRWPDKRVAFYAYHLHSPPPTIQAHPNVIVSVATAFTRKKARPEDLLSAWRERGVRQLGVREYYSVNTWDRSLPGRPRGANLSYLKGSIPRFHDLGARHLSAEAGDDWGPAGLSYYIATRLMWDIREADRVPQLIDDFLIRSFGAAHAPMVEFYSILSSAEKPHVDLGLVRRLYVLLARAVAASDDPFVRARLDDLILYVRYVELYAAYHGAVLGRQEAFERMLTHAYRMRDRMMVHVKPLFTDLPKRDRRVHLPPDAAWDAPESSSPLKSSRPFGREEIDGFLSLGSGGTR